MPSYKKTITLGLDYSQFTGGVKECNENLKILDESFRLANAQVEASGDKLQKTSVKMEYLTQKIYLQQQKVEEAKKKYNALMDAHADTSKINKADAALLKERATLQELENQLSNTRVEHANLKESMTATVTILAGVSAAYLGCAKAAAQYADDIMTLANNTGISTQTLQEWEYASNFVDVSLDTMTSSMEKMIRNMSTAQKGTGDAAEAFKKLGVKLTDTHGKVKDSEAVFLETVDALKEIENQTQRDQLAMAIFGKSAQDLAGVINAGSEGMQEFAQKAHELGVVLSEEDLQVMGEAQDQFDALAVQMKTTGSYMALYVLPPITKLLEVITNIPVPVLATITTMLTVIVTITALVRSIKAITDTGKTISQFFNMFTGGVDKTTLVIAGLVAGLTALVAVIAVLAGKSNQIQATMNSISGATYVNPRTGKVGYNASGTQNWQGGQTWVGENGPELVNLPAGTRIYNNTESKQMANKTYYINMNMDMTKIKSISDVIDAVEGLADSAGSGGEVIA